MDAICVDYEPRVTVSREFKQCIKCNTSVRLQAGTTSDQWSDEVELLLLSMSLIPLPGFYLHTYLINVLKDS